MSSLGGECLAPAVAGLMCYKTRQGTQMMGHESIKRGPWNFGDEMKL